MDKEKERGITIASNPKPLIPQVLIVGGVSKNFQAVYEQLKIMEANGEVVIIHQDIDEYDYTDLKATVVYLEVLEDDLGNIKGNN